MVIILCFTCIQVFCCRRWWPPWYCYSWRHQEWSMPPGLSRCWRRFWTYWTPTTSWPRGWIGTTRRILPGRGSGVSGRGHVKWEGSRLVNAVVFSFSGMLFDWEVKNVAFCLDFLYSFVLWVEYISFQTIWWCFSWFKLLFLLLVNVPILQVSRISTTNTLNNYIVCLLIGYTLEKYTLKPSEDINIIRQADLENHNKDGGLWVVIHGKVYDVQEFKAQAPCGSEKLLQYAGKSLSSNFWCTTLYIYICISVEKKCVDVLLGLAFVLYMYCI